MKVTLLTSYLISLTSLTSQPHQNYAKYHQKHPMAEDRNDPSSFFDIMSFNIEHQTNIKKISPK